MSCGFDQQEVSYIRIDGGTTHRQPLIDKFNDRQSSVALCSLMAAGHGINLTAANHVIHADRWWNPAVENQATDRVHRIGQDKTVYVYRILVQGTLEERIDRLLASKRSMADNIMGAATRRCSQLDARRAAGASATPRLRHSIVDYDQDTQERLRQRLMVVRSAHGCPMMASRSSLLKPSVLKDHTSAHSLPELTAPSV